MASRRSMRRRAAVLATLTVLVGVVAFHPPASAAVPAGTSTVSGVVTYAGGPVAEGARVSLCAPPPTFPVGGYGCLGGGSSSTTTAGADGRYSFPNVEGRRYQLAVSPPVVSLDPWAVITIGPDFTVAEGAAADQPLTLAQGGAVAGTARDAAGAVLAETSISVCGAGEPFCTTAETDESGRYQSRPVAGATARVTFGNPPFDAFAPTLTVSLTPAQITTAPDLQLDPGGLVTVTALDAGSPLGGASIRVSGAHQEEISGVDGSATVRAPSGSQIVTVFPPAARQDLVVTKAPVTVTANGSASVSVTLARGASMTSTFLSAGNGTLGAFNLPYICPLGSTFGTTSYVCIAPNGAPTTPIGSTNFSTGSASGIPPGNYLVSGVTSNGPGAGWLSPAVPLDVASGDTIACTFTIDFVTQANGSTACTGATGSPPGGSNTATLPPAVGGGSVTIASPAGTTLSSVAAVDPASTGSPLPAGISLPFGAFSFRVGVATGASADVTITYPASTPTPNGYAKFVGGAWVDATALVQAQGPGSVTIRLTDGGAGDADGVANGTIVDPGGPAVVTRYRIGAFQAPVDGAPTVNVGKAGRTYPVKFSLTTLTGAPVTDLAAVSSVRSAPVSCATLAAASDALEAEAATSSGLRITGGSFHFNWQSPSARGCQRLTITLADGQVLQANFELR
ncbi:choice-of-anchor U domain-containing protein [Aquihabitans daechungensis]|uniref:choice-of-anchor U domain-containing protein n=1 Tax=Aquihabitans daechungensis TaxID=1052257 RepID=UPI003B9E345E